MNPPSQPESISSLKQDLQAFSVLCEQALDMVTRESQALSDHNPYQPAEFDQLRKNLLPELELALISLRNQRQSRRQTTHSEEMLKLFQDVQSMLTRILQLDRENQQALLRRGLVPAKFVPPAAAMQPHYVTGLYRQNSRAPSGTPV